jgi:hypothetical protein
MMTEKVNLTESIHESICRGKVELITAKKDDKIDKDRQVSAILAGKEKRSIVMYHNRIGHSEVSLPISTAVASLPTAEAFVMCPAALMQGWMGQSCLWLAAYQRAYEVAQAVVRPSLLERLHNVSWN